MIQKLIFTICCIAWAFSQLALNGSQNDTPRETLIQYAASHLEHKRSVIDCSMLVQNAYAEIGIKVGRSSRDQALQGVKVSIEGAKAGDIILFHNASRINHSGLVHHTRDDTLYFIHRSSSRSVVIDHLAMPYFKQRFHSIRSILND